MNDLQIHYFLSAVETGNFTVAAAENNISQSSFSKWIMALEKELNVKLFNREKRQFSLTPAGEFFLDYAKQYESALFSMRNDLIPFMDNPPSSLRISSIPVLYAYGLSELFTGFKAQNSDISMDILELSESTNVYESIKKNESDFAIVRSDFITPDDYDIIPLITDELIIVVSQSHPLAIFDCISITQLKDAKMSFPTKGSDFYNICILACLKGGFTPAPAYTISGRLIMLDMIKKDGIVGFSMEKLISPYIDNTLKVIHFNECIPSITSLVHYKKYTMTPNAKKFWNYVKKQVIQKPASK